MNDYLVKLASDNMDGASWYDDAEIEIGEVCQREDWDASRFTSILALTSPRVSVRRNVRIALSFMEHGVFQANVIRGIRRSVLNWIRTGTINGPKVSAFARALRGDANAIVLDVHMANLFGVKQSSLGTLVVKRYCESLVLGVADDLGISPRDAQACLWFGQVRSRGRVPYAFPVRQEYANWLAYGKRFPSTGTIRQYASRNGEYQTCLFAT